MKTAIRLKVILILVLLCSCRPGDGRFDVSLQQAETAISTSPRDAMAMLDSINPDELSESRRHYYDLLTIMARDKAYITHTSDSLILDVVDYYSSRKSDPLYPKALYLGGRVYSDLGDYPTALNYFHDALEMLPEDEDENLDFRANVISQTARLFNQIRCYSQAITCLEDAINIDVQLSDTFGLAYDKQLLGSIYSKLNDYDQAYSYMVDAMSYASTLSRVDSANIAIYIADIQLAKGNVDSALLLVRNLPANVSPLAKNRALGTAALIYLSAGVPDTAYMYANELVRSNYLYNRHTGYRLLLSPELRRFIPQDSLPIYFEEYVKVLDKVYDSNESQAVLIQNAYYNYQKHVKEREQLKVSRDNIVRNFYILLILGLSFLSIHFLFKYRDSLKELKFHRAMDFIKLRLNYLSATESVACKPSLADFCWENEENIQSIRSRMKSYLKDMKKEPYIVPDVILQSEAYKSIITLLASRDGIHSELIWEEIAKAVEKCSPGFKQKLISLTGGRLSESDFQIILLIKCGFTPKDMTILLIKAKGSISSRRAYLSKKIFGENIGISEIDCLIRCL